MLVSGAVPYFYLTLPRLVGKGPLLCENGSEYFLYKIDWRRNLTTLIIAVHIIVCLVLIVVILLQSGSAGGMGAAFGGGSSQTLFGGTGSTKFFTRLTAIFAALFMITSLSLTIMSAHRAKGTVMQGYTPPPVQAPAQKAVPADKAPAPAAASEKPAPKPEAAAAPASEPAPATAGEKKHTE